MGTRNLFTITERTAVADDEKLALGNGTDLAYNILWSNFIKLFSGLWFGGSEKAQAVTDGIDLLEGRVVNLGSAEAETDATNLRDVKLELISDSFNGTAKLKPITSATLNRGFSIDNYFNHTFISLYEHRIPSNSNIDVMYTTLNISNEIGFYAGVRPSGEFILAINDGTRHDLSISTTDSDLSGNLGLLALILGDDNAILYFNGIEIGRITGLTNVDLLSETPILSKNNNPTTFNFGSIFAFNRALEQEEILDAALGRVNENEKNGRGLISDSTTLDSISNSGGSTAIINGNVITGTTGTSGGYPRISIIPNSDSNIVKGRTYKLKINTDLTGRNVTIYLEGAVSGTPSFQIIPGGEGAVDVTFTALNTFSRIALGGLGNLNSAFGPVTIESLEFVEIGQIVDFPSSQLGHSSWEGVINGEQSFINVTALDVVGDIKEEKAQRNITQTSTITNGQRKGYRYEAITVTNNTDSDTNFKVQENSTGSFVIGDGSTFETIPANQSISYVPMKHQLFDVHRDIDLILENDSNVEFIVELKKVK